LYISLNIYISFQHTYIAKTNIFYFRRIQELAIKIIFNDLGGKILHAAATKIAYYPDKDGRRIRILSIFMLIIRYLIMPAIVTLSLGVASYRVRAVVKFKRHRVIFIWS